MPTLYYILAGIHLLAVVVTGMLWTIIDLVPGSRLRRHLRDIRAVHFGSLYLVPMFLGMAHAFERLQVPAGHQILFPAGLGSLLFFAGVGYLFPRRKDLDPFYYWTSGWPMVLALIRLACLALSLAWTAILWSCTP